MSEYTGTGNFRMWCLMNLPDYKGTESYKELLSKCVTYLNSLLAQTTRISTAVDYILDAYDGLVNYNSHYPTDIEYVNQVNNELDSWASYGLPELLQAGIQKIINDRSVE